MHPKTYSGRLKQSRVDLFSLFMIADKASTMEKIYKKGVGVVRDKEVKLRMVKPHTLGGAGGKGVSKKRDVNRKREARKLNVEPPGSNDSANPPQILTV